MSRARHGVGLLLVGVILVQAAIVAPASRCERLPLYAGGDMVPGFCVDYGAAWQGWPMLVVGLLLTAWGTAMLGRAAGDTAFPATLRLALALGVLGVVVAYAAWSYGGSHEICVRVFDGHSEAPSCTMRPPSSWQVPVYLVGGALMGSGLTLGAAAWVRSR